MNTSNAKTQTLIDVIESVIGIRLNHKTIVKDAEEIYASLNLDTLELLKYELINYYESIELPEKKAWELRPLISHMINSPTVDLSHPDSRYSTKEYVISQLKRLLLYCHSVCIWDPLPSYLRWYFPIEIEADLDYLLEIVIDLLIIYGRLEPLIRKNIIIPLDTFQFVSSVGQYSNPEYYSELVMDFRLRNAVKNEKYTYIKDLLNKDYESRQRLMEKDGSVMGEQRSVLKEKSDREAIAILASESFLSAEIDYLHSNLTMKRTLEHKVDLFLPAGYYSTILRELLYSSEIKFNSFQIIEPFNISIIQSVETINPELVELKDILRMREQEELFEEWRTIITEVLEKLYTSKECYTDLSNEFSNILRQKLLIWNDKLKTRKRRSSFINQVYEHAEKAGIGAISGGISGFMTSGSEGSLLGVILGSAIGGLIGPGVEFTKDLLKVGWNSKNSLTLRNHFLSIGVKDL